MPVWYDLERAITLSLTNRDLVYPVQYHCFCDTMAPNHNVACRGRWRTSAEHDYETLVWSFLPHKQNQNSVVHIKSNFKIVKWCSTNHLLCLILTSATPTSDPKLRTDKEIWNTKDNPCDDLIRQACLLSPTGNYSSWDFLTLAYLDHIPTYW